MNNPISYVDPTGCAPKWWHWVTSGLMVVGGIALCFVPGFQIVGGALIGAGIGSMAGGYIAEAYGYDFNLGYGLGMAAGALIGAGIAYAAPYIGSFMSSSWTFGSQAMMTATGEMIMTAGITITGAQVLAGAGALALGGLYMFAKGNGPRMGHNQYENKQIDQLCNKYRLTKDQRRILHDYISGQNLTYRQIEQIIIELFFS